MTGPVPETPRRVAFEGQAEEDEVDSQQDGLADRQGDPRTMLRYAIEKLPPRTRRAYLTGAIGEPR